MSLFPTRAHAPGDSFKGRALWPMWALLGLFSFACSEPQPLGGTVDAECAARSQSSCATDGRCQPLSGTPRDPYCRGERASRYAGCVAIRPCDDAITWGKDPKTGDVLLFPCTTLPLGWSATSEEQCGGTTIPGPARDGGPADAASCGPTPCPGVASWNPSLCQCVSSRPATDVECASRSEASCSTDQRCEAVLGAAPDAYCRDDSTSWGKIYGGCVPGPRSCGTATTWAKDPTTGRTLVFPCTTIPTGWVTLAGDQCRRDGGPPPPVDASLGKPLPCDELAPGHAAELTSFGWERQRDPACSASRCYDFLTVTATCELRFQRNDVGRSARASAEDCAAIQRWITSDPFVSTLEGPPICADGKGTFESFELELSGPRLPRMKTSQCPHPVLDAVRTCLGGIISKYFP